MEVDDVGKGKKGKAGKGKGNSGATQAPVTGTWHWCGKPGHYERDCRNKAAGKPRTASTTEPNGKGKNNTKGEGNKSKSVHSVESGTGSSGAPATATSPTAGPTGRTVAMIWGSEDPNVEEESWIFHVRSAARRM